MTVAFSCVMDKKPKYGYQAVVWASSLIHLAGRRPEELVVHAVDGGMRLFAAKLRGMGVQVVACKTHDARHLCSNKLAQMSSSALQHASHVVMMDCDTVAVEDLAPWVVGDRVRAKPVNTANPSYRHWVSIFKAAGLSHLPAWGRASHVPDTTYRNNVNGGVYIFPQRALHAARQVWPKWNRWLLDHPHVLGPACGFTDQVSFGLTMEELNEEVDLLPVALNFSTHHALEHVPDDNQSPLIIHYHHRLDADGFLMPTGRRSADLAIERVNRMIHGTQACQWIKSSRHPAHGGPY